MKADLEHVKQSVRATDISPLRVTGFEQAKHMAEFLAKAQIVPEAYRGKPADIVVAIGMGAELGLGPFQSLQAIYVISGRPSLYVEAALAIVLASGLCESYHVEGSETEATATMKRRGVTEPIVQRFTFEQATKLGLVTRSPAWSQQRQWMLETRATGRVLHRLFPDLLKGLGIIDMAGAVEQGVPAPAPIDVKDRLRAKLAEVAERPEPVPVPDGEDPPPTPDEPPGLVPPTPPVPNTPDVAAPAGPSDQELTMLRGRIIADMNALSLTPAMQTILVKRHAGVSSLGELGQASLDGLIALQDELEVQKKARQRPRSAA
jgi:hypothetical protein